jgi:hypothetical protein
MITDEQLNRAEEIETEYYRVVNTLQVSDGIFEENKKKLENKRTKLSHEYKQITGIDIDSFVTIRSMVNLIKKCMED